MNGSLGQYLDQSDRRGDTRDEVAEICFQSFLQEAIVSRSDIGRDVHSLTSSTQNVSMDGPDYRKDLSP